MVLIWLWLKATQTINYPDDWWRGLVLAGLDLIATAEWYRIWLHKRGR